MIGYMKYYTICLLSMYVLTVTKGVAKRFFGGEIMFNI